jgi:UDP-hydrolysing UDP-N-acetyl-D-glucosamine 2-epimerase
MIKVGFLTGARSEYGVAKPLLLEFLADSDISLKIFVSGMHLLEKYGYTVSEIESDGFQVAEKIETYNKSCEKALQFSNSVGNIFKALQKHDLDIVFIIGDRIEAYSATLAAHFLSIPVAHFGGGTLTEGAVDNYYRYNISNLAALHFTTSKNNYSRLLDCILLNNRDVHFTGSLAVDNILKHISLPTGKSKSQYTPNNAQYAVITFHPVTLKSENIPDLLKVSVEVILRNGCDVIITYPNNDSGSDEIIRVIEQFREYNDPRIGIFKNLGADAYHKAIQGCLFIVGNSSSGVIEAPYFRKIVLNVGDRQKGRDKDKAVYDVAADSVVLGDAIEAGFKTGWNAPVCNEIYGSGGSAKKIVKIIKKYYERL